MDMVSLRPVKKTIPAKSPKKPAKKPKQPAPSLFQGISDETPKTPVAQPIFQEVIEVAPVPVEEPHAKPEPISASTMAQPVEVAMPKPDRTESRADVVRTERLAIVRDLDLSHDVPFSAPIGECVRLFHESLDFACIALAHDTIDAILRLICRVKLGPRQAKCADIRSQFAGSDGDRCAADSHEDQTRKALVRAGRLPGAEQCRGFRSIGARRSGIEPHLGSRRTRSALSWAFVGSRQGAARSPRVLEPRQEQAPVQSRSGWLNFGDQYGNIAAHPKRARCSGCHVIRKPSESHSAGGRKLPCDSGCPVSARRHSDRAWGVRRKNPRKSGAGGSPRMAMTLSGGLCLVTAISRRFGKIVAY